MPAIETPIEMHSPDLYRADGAAGGVCGFDSVDAAALELFGREGYLVIHQAFSALEVDAARQAIAALIDRAHPSFDGIYFEASARDCLDTLSPAARRLAVRKLMSFVQHDTRLLRVAADQELLGVVRRIVGDEPELFQDMALLKPPHGREKPWHQDKAYFDFPLDTPVVGAWIALDEATVENGCMHILPGSHREGASLHFQLRDWQICDTEISGRRCLAVPMQPGGCLLFDGLLAHGTPYNATPRTRWALQFHYSPAHRRAIPTAERLAIFGAEGKNVSC